MKNNHLKRFIELFQEKQDLLNEILLITMKQEHFIRIGKIHVLERQIQRKQELMDKIGGLEKEWKDLIDILKSTDPEVLGKELEEIKEISMKIKEADDKNREKLKLDLDILGNEIRNVNKRKVVSNAYGNVKKNNAKSFFLDQKK